MTMYRAGKIPEWTGQGDIATWEKILEVLPAAMDTLVHTARDHQTGVAEDRALPAYTIAERHIQYLIQEGWLVEVEKK
jgi:hypothetical protein